MDLIVFVTVIALVAVLAWVVIVYSRPHHPSAGEFVFTYDTKNIWTSHLRSVARLGTHYVPVILDTGYGDSVTVTEGVLLTFGNPPEDAVPPLKPPYHEPAAPASPLSAARRAELLRAANVAPAGTVTRTMQALVTTQETTGTVGYGVLQLMGADGTLRAAERRPTNTRIVTTYTKSNLPAIITMPYLVERAPVALRYGGLVSDKCADKGDIKGKMTLEFGRPAPRGALQPKQFPTGGVVAFACTVTPLHGHPTSVNLIFDTGFSGYVSINQSVVDDMRACGSLEDDIAIKQRDVFDNVTCTAVFSAAVALELADGGQVSLGTKAPVYATDTDMPSSVHGLIGLAAMQSMDWYIRRSALLRLPTILAVPTCTRQSGENMLQASLLRKDQCVPAMKTQCDALDL